MQTNVKAAEIRRKKGVWGRSPQPPKGCQKIRHFEDSPQKTRHMEDSPHIGYPCFAGL